MSIRTPNYITTYAVTVYINRDDYIVIPEGYFVRPLRYDYVPIHIIDRYPGFDKNTQVFVYTRLGTFPIPKNYVLEV